MLASDCRAQHSSDLRHGVVSAQAVKILVLQIRASMAMGDLELELLRASWQVQSWQGLRGTMH